MRISRDKWAIEMAKLTATRSTCLRRHVGCVFLNARGHVLATGYNGVATGQKHCNEEKERPKYSLGSGAGRFSLRGPDAPIVTHPHACSGAKSPSGMNLDGCQAIHAEQNALLQCRDIYDLDVCYVTASPCMTCTKLLLNTSCQRIVFLEEYPHTEARELWESAGRKWEKFSNSAGICNNLVEENKLNELDEQAFSRCLAQSGRTQSDPELKEFFQHGVEYARSESTRSQLIIDPAQVVEAVRDSVTHGTGIMKDGQHVPIADVYLDSSQDRQMQPPTVTIQPPTEVVRELVDKLETLVLIVGLTAFKYESQREVLQVAVDQAATALDSAKEHGL